MFKGSYEDFFDALRQRESGGDYTVVNSAGFLGAYQFGEAALVDLGFVTNDGSPFDNQYNGTFTGKAGVHSVGDFLNSVTAQDQAAAEWFPLLWNRIRANDLEFYDGQTLNGVLLTKTGMVAAAHLLGVGGLKNFILSGGVDAGADGFGTSIVEYINLLGNYEAPAAFINNLDKDNVIFGGTGDDSLVGMEGNDTLVGREGNDILDGGAGDDIIDGAAGLDQIFGGDGNDLIDGGTGADWIEGGSGQNTLRGASGDDTFIISTGSDIVETGSGNDIVKVLDLSGTTRISDFEQGVDLIDLSQISSAVLVSDGRCATQQELADSLVFVQIGGDTIAAIEKHFPKGLSADYGIEDAFLIFENSVAAEFDVADDFIWS